MTEEHSPTLRLRARGPLACFTRPELKVERISYEVPTPSAARGLIEAVLWKPAIVWHIERIRVLNEIRFTAFRRNEVNSKALSPRAATVSDGGEAPLYFADEDRAQRNTVALRDVDYVIEAHFHFTERRGEADNMTKFVEMFQRRVAKGQHFHQPYLGCREFVAEILPAEDAPPPLDLTKDLGLMLWDIHFDERTAGPPNHTPLFYAARLERGVIEVPEDPLATLAGAGAGEVSPC